VSAGTVLVRIRSAEYEDKVHQADSQAAAAEAVALKAKRDYERATRLFASQSLTKADFDGAQAQYDATQSQLKAARAFTSEAEVALRDTSVVAPFDGEIVQKVGRARRDSSGPGSPVFDVAPTDLVKIVIGVCPDLALPLRHAREMARRRCRRRVRRIARSRLEISRMATAAGSPDGELRGRGRIPNRDSA
jgi:RND family efflux transporter MFP subunit